MIEQAQVNQLVKGPVPEYVENGITFLQYADDTILCYDDEEQARNLKYLLYLYEQMSGLKNQF